MKFLGGSVVVEVPAAEMGDYITRFSNKDEVLNMLDALATSVVARHWPEGTTDPERQQIRIEFKW